MNIGIIGYGYVGRALARFFSKVHRVTIYDKFQERYNSSALKTSINECDFAFVAVPTPVAAGTPNCDTSAVEDVLSWSTVALCIKSTIPPGTTDRLASLYGSQLVFSPEYIGESIGHPWKDVSDCGFLILGGSGALAELVTTAYRSIDETIKVVSTSSKTAELCKYMENAFLATKITFVNQFYDIATTMGVDFDELVRLWQLDRRIGESHCKVTMERGFGGRCLPKDLQALVGFAKPFTSTEFLEAVLSYNDKIRLQLASESNLGLRHWNDSPVTCSDRK